MSCLDNCLKHDKLIIRKIGTPNTVPGNIFAPQNGGYDNEVTMYIGL